MAQYQHPKEKGRRLDVGDNEGAKARMLQRLGWKPVPQGQEVKQEPKATAPKQGKQTAKTTDSPKPLNVQTDAGRLEGVDVQPVKEAAKPEKKAD